MDEERKARMDMTPDKREHSLNIIVLQDLIREQKAEIERLREKCDKQAMVIRRIYAEQLPDTWFVCGEIGEKDRNGLPKYIEVCPAYGVDWSQLYERTDRTIGGMGS
jgi:hypothetical protein